MISEKTIKRFDEADVVGMYNSNMTYNEIEEKLHTSYNLIHQYLIMKNVKSRRAARRKQLRPPAPIGKKFGLWTVVSDEVKNSGELGNVSNDRSLFWLVQCKCGELAWKSKTHLLDGTSTRCKKCGNKNFVTDNGEIIINAIIKSKYNALVCALPRRKKVSKLNFNITPEYLNDLFEKDHFCKLSGLDLSFDLSKRAYELNISIDRIDSNKGYIKGNILLVDKRINMMKGTLSNDEFINLCCKVAEKHGWSRCE